MHATISFLGLALFFIIVLPFCKAQASYENDLYGSNLTLTFGGNDGQGTFSFSTASAPSAITCINLEEVFVNNTNNVVDDTVSFTAINATLYNPSTNYTSLGYQQSNSTAADGQFAARSVEVFSGRNCQTNPGVGAWYGFSCQNAEGETYTIPGGVQSFSIVSHGESVNQDSCWTLAANGESAAPAALKGGLAAMMAAVVLGSMLML